MDERIRASRKQEKAGLKRVGGRSHSGSGSGPFRKNDGSTSRMEDRAVNSGLLLEYKTVLGGKRQITIKLDDLLGVVSRAVRQSRFPLLSFELGKKNWAIVPEEDLLELLEYRYGPAAE